jgi:hypothetical protein
MFWQAIAGGGDASHWVKIRENNGKNGGGNEK